MRINSSHWLTTRPIAHRGLWNENFPENSLSAYKNAIEKGYPIEIDVHKSLDGVLFVFHDDNLKRLTGEDALLHQKTFQQLKTLRLNNTSEEIPTLKEVLEFVNGRVPLLIEIKNQPDSSVVDDTVQLLKNYNGQFAVQSFNPFYILKIKKLAPQFIRGILGCIYKEKMGLIKKHVVKNLSLNFIIKPDFISYRLTDLPLRKKTKLPLLCWTITDKNQEALAKSKANNIIFENFIPKN